ncbi:extracellular solute-binding protein [Beggiatoa leptomitoformis]|uniref:Extracellular solute-binding protein n=1 Tax=Beggiatoa leptomitoformis TaxID=288004 RepID=A0A2N9YJC4_9GAMM|nr:extracellular solute-binding protein [Beggiatoa leptomitoformis]ALG69469.2 extracellular solute-binding protein [Beggiatoa leptomitoformis]AUI70622.2 extracellular solute-binding protein [Beggiatoa leptomitoformis]
MLLKKIKKLSMVFTVACLGLSPVVWSADEIIVYSARNDSLIKPLFDLYTKETGVTIKFTTAEEAALLERLQAEGENTPADMLITVDAGNLWQATERDVLASVDSSIIQKNIPAYLRDPKNRWTGLSIRSRTIMYSTQRVKPEELSTYAALADKQWKGRLCLRTSKKVYNQSMVGMMISQLGEEKTEIIVNGWVANLATDVFSNDTKLIEAIAAGQCDVGIANTYYLGRLQAEKPDLPVAIFWSQDGAHVNISGAGITKYAKHREAAIKLLEWLTTPDAQKVFAELNYEYPANPSVSASELVKKWGEFKPNTIDVVEAGRLQVEAVKLMDRAGYK